MSPRTRQYTEALAVANGHKQKRTELKRDLSNNSAIALTLLLDPPEWMLGMRTYDFVMAVPRMGDYKTEKLLNEVGIFHTMTSLIGKTTPRQRRAIHDALLPKL